MIRTISEHVYEFLRNAEEDLDKIFLEVEHNIRYLSVGNLTGTLYDSDTEEYRIDVDFSVEFNITR